MLEGATESFTFINGKDQCQKNADLVTVSKIFPLACRYLSPNWSFLQTYCEFHHISPLTCCFAFKWNLVISRKNQKHRKWSISASLQVDLLTVAASARAVLTPESCGPRGTSPGTSSEGVIPMDLITLTVAVLMFGFSRWSDYHPANWPNNIAKAGTTSMFAVHASPRAKWRASI